MSVVVRGIAVCQSSFGRVEAQSGEVRFLQPLRGRPRVAASLRAMQRCAPGVLAPGVLQRLCQRAGGIVFCAAATLGVAHASEPVAPVEPPLSLAAGQALAARSRCLACHEIDRRRVGPPFRAIARRFGGQAELAPRLAQVMRQGSSGQWGAIPMPAQTQLSPADAMQLARWILSLAR